MEILKQNEFIIEGTGKIIYDHSQDDARFQISYNPQKVILKTFQMPLGHVFASYGYGRFEGFIGGTNVKIKCSKIAFGLYDKDKYQTSFQILEDLIIGDDVPFHVFKAKLFGIIIDVPEFRIGSYLISIKRFENFDEINSLKKYGCNLEEGEIVIKNFESKTIEKNVTIKMCKEICLMLSFISGVKVFYNRCELTNDKKQSQKIMRINTANIGSYNKGFLPQENIEKILPIFYENFSKMKPNEKKCLFTSIDYLNSKSNKYLEELILRVAQIWEILSDTFLVEEVKNAKIIIDLREVLKKTIREWHKNNKSNGIKDYDFSFIMGRVLTSLDWEKAIKKMEKLVEKENLNSETIGLDFKTLVELRNQIAHSGRFEKTGEEYQNHYGEVYSSALFGVRVLILKKLGYTGYIFREQKFENIGDYIKIEENR